MVREMTRSTIGVAAARAGAGPRSTTLPETTAPHEGDSHPPCGSAAPFADTLRSRPSPSFAATAIRALLGAFHLADLQVRHVRATVGVTHRGRLLLVDGRGIAGLIRRVV